MPDTNGFLGRWSRRKAEAREAERPEWAPRAERPAEAAPQGEPNAGRAAEAGPDGGRAAAQDLCATPDSGAPAPADPRAGTGGYAEATGGAGPSPGSGDRCDDRLGARDGVWNGGRERDGAAPRGRSRTGAPDAARPGLPDPQPELPPDLPALDSLGAGSDFTPFMRPGVPKALRNAALRRAWATAPAITGHRPLVDYDWDFNAPGYGRLRPGDDAAAFVATLFRGLRRLEAAAAAAEAPTTGGAGPAAAAAAHNEASPAEPAGVSPLPPDGGPEPPPEPAAEAAAAAAPDPAPAVSAED